MLWLTIWTQNRVVQDPLSKACANQGDMENLMIMMAYESASLPQLSNMMTVCCGGAGFIRILTPLKEGMD
jgi:hypothetical protein